MKVTPYIFFAIGLTSFSCASTPKTTVPAEASLTPQEYEQTAIEPTAEVNTSIDEAAIAFEAYVAKFSAITLSVESSPREISAAKAFATPYVVKATNADGTPAEAIPLTVRFPKERAEDGGIIYNEAEIVTQSDGTASFTPETPLNPCNDVIIFSPKIDDSSLGNERIVSYAQEKSVTAPFLVHTRRLQAGGSIALVDFTQSGTPIRNRSDSSSALLINLMQKGFSRIGNADFTDQVAGGNKDAVYKAAKALFGNASSFLIFGTIKYAEPMQKTDSGIVCTLVADLTCIDMKDGRVLYHSVTEKSATEKQEWSALTAARTALAKDLAVQIFYGL